jgi:phenylalanyl-tRNA synthetase alpha chain
MQGYLIELQTKALAEILAAKSSDELEKLRVKYLGRKSGELTKIISELPEMSVADKRVIGPLANQIKTTIESSIKDALGSSNKIGASTLPLDVTAPGKKYPVGKLHPVSQAFDEIIEIFKEIGFSYASGPEVEWFWYAFEALNMPADHPAADDFETFYIEARPHPKYGRMLLRPHNSSVQIRTMGSSKPPIRIVAPGRSFRPNYDASHIPSFYQFEGLMVDRDVSIGNLKAVLEYFVRRFFGPDIAIRLRPHHFNFTEPSFEVDITCTVCKGKGCPLCEKSGWLELGGSGMVHPNVFKNVGLDPNIWSGFAWGWGIERCVAIRHQIPDVRVLYENDLRLLSQF